MGMSRVEVNMLWESILDSWAGKCLLQVGKGWRRLDGPVASDLRQRGDVHVLERPLPQPMNSNLSSVAEPGIEVGDDRPVQSAPHAYLMSC